MVRIEFTTEIERPAQEIFEYLIDVERLPEWQSSALESSAAEPLAQGVRIRERRRVMGREIENELEVTAYEPPRRLTLKGLKGPVKFTVDHELTESDGTTALHVVAEGRAGAFMKLGEPMLARTAEQELRKDFARLKELLEAEGYPSRAAPVD
ncbi:MAG TPA: SRPBCC family protein [Gaiellaceae bacterium]|nr:SRPBCC family protein [Gaiellaceae bacterium]